MKLIEKIVQKYDNSSRDWWGVTEGNRSLRIQQKDFDEVGKSRLLKEAAELEAQGLIRVKWFNNKTDIEQVFYSLKDLPKMHQMLGRISKVENLRKIKEYVNEQMKEVKEFWILACYEAMIQQLEKGTIPKNLLLSGIKTEYEYFKENDEGENFVDLFCTCLKGLDALNEPIYKRVFSKHYLGNSKTFEKKLQVRIISQARKYHPNVDDNMNDSEVLSQLYIEDYSQELAVKGELILELNGVKIDLSSFIYGTVLTSGTLKHARIADQQKIQKVITVENKANYMSMNYEPGTLIIFSHGYFSPKERDFLKELEGLLGDQEITFLHTGDLDYGGVRIFQYIRTHIFPKLQPYLMDVAQYEAFKSLGEEMEDSTWEKMKSLNEPLLQPLIDKIIEEKITIEQECFLYR